MTERTRPVGGAAHAFSWRERPVGPLGRVELHALALRLHRVPAGAGRLRIDWDQVSHMDFRGVAEVAAQLHALKTRGVEIDCSGLNPYLLAILRFALTLEDIELFTGAAGSVVRLPARAREDRTSAVGPDLSSWSFRKN